MKRNKTHNTHTQGSIKEHTARYTKKEATLKERGTPSKQSTLLNE